VQGARASHLFQLGLQPDDAVGDQTPVQLDLGFAGPTGRTGAAPLPLKVGPGPHQPRPLIIQSRQFDLKPPLLGPRATAEDFQDQAGAVDDLHLPRLFQIALLHRRQGVVDDDSLGVCGAHERGQLLDLARAEQGRWRGAAQPNDLFGTHIEVQRAGKARSLLKPFARQPGTVRASVGVNDDRPDQRDGVVDQFLGQSVFFGVGLVQLNGRGRHNG